MAYPKVSILWLNYNSSHILDIIKASLDSAANINYPDYELIVVDNASSDNSPIFIKSYLLKMDKLKIKFVRTNRNLGYVGGNNVAYSLRSRESKYIAVMNNDFIAEPESLKDMVEFLENDPSVGAIQGKILDANGEKIDSAGGLVDEFLRVRFPFREEPPQNFLKSFLVSFVEGTFPFYRVDAIRRILGNFLFPPEGFIYFLEDVFVGIKLWNTGYKSLCVPISVGRHFRSKTIKSLKSNFLLYHGVKNRVALLVASNSRLKIFGLGSILKTTLEEVGFERKKTVLNAVLQGINLGYKIYKRYGLMDIYSAPVIRNKIKV
jgi:GT2 family glycosyltransferase